MKCPVCKSDNALQSGKCQHCGAPLSSGEMETQLMASSPVHQDAPSEGTGAPEDLETQIMGHSPVHDTSKIAPDDLETQVMSASPAKIGGGTAWAQTNSFQPRNLLPGELGEGVVLAGRYEIVKTLGEGGMGAVFKARDMELDRMLALKVIHAGLANQAEILERFKRELILARQVTHKNVIRIFDLGQADGVRFITMEFVQGRDLKSHLTNKTPWTLEEKVKIVIQICRALEAAHAEEVVHRDLKPQNIMIEESTGRVVVMDFGIAYSMQNAGLTSTGALIGTPAYMSPEQAKGENVDTRSDIFSLGIVCYELLTGRVPYEAETAVGLLLKRIQERPIPPVERDQAIPQALSDIVLKALVVDRNHRYQTATEMRQDLEGWLGAPSSFTTVINKSQIANTGLIPGSVPSGDRIGLTPEGHAIVTPAMAMMQKSNTWKWITLFVGIVAIILAGVFAYIRITSAPAGPHAPVTVVIADIANHTGDPVFDGTLEPMLKIALEGAGFISAYDRTQMRTLGVQAVSAKFDEAAAQQVALGQGLGVVLSGSLDKKGNEYGLSLKASQAVTGNNLVIADGDAPNKDQVLSAVTQVAAKVRKALGDDTSESAQRFAMESLSASSIEAVHEYAAAMNSLSSGKWEDARKSFSKAVDLDPNFGLAHAGTAIASLSLGEHDEAEKNAREAIRHIDRMTERERYRTRGMFYVVTGDQSKCVDEYSSLIAKFPSDVAAHNNLGTCYSQLRNMPKAIEEMRKAVEILPKRALYQFNLSLYYAFIGDFSAAEKQVRAAQKLNPAYVKGYLTLAYSQIGQNRIADAIETYHQLEKLSPAGGSLASSGLADLAIYEGRLSEAARVLEKAANEDFSAKRTRSAADKLTALAYVEVLRGQKARAIAAADRALANDKDPKTRFLAARAYLSAGESQKPKDLLAGLSSELLNEPQAYGKLLEAQVALQQGDSQHAVRAATEANKLVDTWIGHFDLGKAYLAAGAFTEADSEFDRCIKRQGEAMELFIDDTPTYGYFPAVYYYQAKVREGLKSPGSKDSLAKYLEIRGKAAEDPLLAEVRRGVGK